MTSFLGGAPPPNKCVVILIAFIDPVVSVSTVLPEVIWVVLSVKVAATISV